MSQTNTNIQLRRSVNEFNRLLDQQLSFAEPFFIDNTTHDTGGNITEPCSAYLVLGRKPDSDETVTIAKSPVIKATTFDKSNKFVFYNENNTGLINENNESISADKVSATEINSTALPTEIDKFYILCQPENSNDVYKFNLSDVGIFISNRGIMKGAAWNDYAEFRKIDEDALPGQVVCDTEDGVLKLSNKRLQCCPHVVSDTFGQIIGNDKDSIPIAVAGRVLVAVDSSLDNIEIGDCVCASYNGLASKMTRQEIINYPDRILGVVCEIPNYNNIDDVYIDGRVWINIK